MQFVYSSKSPRKLHGPFAALRMTKLGLKAEVDAL